MAGLMITRAQSAAVLLGRRFLSRRAADRIRVYGVGTAKSGTHSIAAMFDPPVRAAHEADATPLLRRILGAAAGRIRDEELRTYLRRRDRRLRLDIDSSQLNYFVLDMLLDTFPGARFILTIRDCYSWLDSFINDSLRRPTSNDWLRLRDLRFRPDRFTHPPAERLLAEHGLYTLDGYLSYWATHNQQVLARVPAEQLLVVRTDHLTENTVKIADFAGLPRAMVRRDRSHAFANPAKERLLHRIEQAHLEDRVRAHCQPLMDRFFPEIRSREDVDG